MLSPHLVSNVKYALNKNPLSFELSFHQCEWAFYCEYASFLILESLDSTDEGYTNIIEQTGKTENWKSILLLH